MEIRVYYEDTDCGGVVYYANYLRYFERARTEFLRSQGVDFAALVDEGYLFTVDLIIMNGLGVTIYTVTCRRRLLSQSLRCRVVLVLNVALPRLRAISRLRLGPAQNPAPTIWVLYRRRLMHWSLRCRVVLVLNVALPRLRAISRLRLGPAQNPAPTIWVLYRRRLLRQSLRCHFKNNPQRSVATPAVVFSFRLGLTQNPAPTLVDFLFGFGWYSDLSCAAVQLTTSPIHPQGILLESRRPTCG